VLVINFVKQGITPRLRVHVKFVQLEHILRLVHPHVLPALLERTLQLPVELQQLYVPLVTLENTRISKVRRRVVTSVQPERFPPVEQPRVPFVP
jgi:hypothetical protein